MYVEGYFFSYYFFLFLWFYGKDVIVMAYSAPSAVITGQSITAALYNTYVKDNVLDHESRIVTAGPAGLVSPFAGASAPSGWLLCDGSAVSQTTYAVLYAVVGANAFGTDGGGNFSLPNLKGRTVIGVGVGTEITGVRGTLQGAATLPAHTHPVAAWATTDSAGNHGHTVRAASGGAIVDGNDGLVRGSNIQDPSFSGPIGASGSHNHTIPATTTSSTGTGSHGVVQPSMPLNYIIKF